MKECPRPNKRVTGSVSLPLVCAVWVAVIVAGMAVVVKYEMTPGLQPRVESTAHIARRDKPKLVMYLHPQCPCSTATLEELDRLMMRCKGKLETEVFFVTPKAASKSWTESGMVARARQIAGVTVQFDPEGRAARAAKASTSGATFLYNSQGAQVFQGGITPSRGHEGDNEGEATIATFVATGRIRTPSAPVFGCYLADLGYEPGNSN